MYLMGIDIGTSSTKTAIFNEKGDLLSLASKQHNFDADRPGYAEQDPEVWWDAAISSMKEAIGKFHGNPKEIQAIGLSGQMHGMVPLDKEGKVIRKAILHCDVRANVEVEEIKSLFKENKFSEITYNPVFPGFQAISLYWLRKHEPQNYNRTRIVICPKDYVRYRMTGNIGIDSSDASGTLFYDMKNECWSKEVFERLDFDLKVVPERINNPYDIDGKIKKDVAELTGLSENVKVVFGGADQAMHSIGNGVYKSGIMMVTIGTSGQVLMVSDLPVLNRNLNTHVFHHVNPHTWFGLGAVLYAGSTLNWFKRNFSENYTYSDLDNMADEIKPCSDGMVFFPCMGGVRTPYVDTRTRGIYSGISLSHTRGHFARATMEGVTFAGKSCIDIMNTLYGKENKLVCAGGGAKSLTWAQIQADVYGREIFISNISEQACLGAAIVAGIGAGAFSSLDEACSQMVDSNERKIEPNLKNTAIYQSFYEAVYQNLYDANTRIFENMQNY
jgi:xylulokinase